MVVGYFSLEFGLAECLPIYSGGLGVLAGDHLKATSDLGLPLVAVGLFYKQGFGRQEIDAGGRQVEAYFENKGEELPVRRVEGVEVDAPIGDRKVKIGVWRAQVGRVPLFLLDTDLESNPPDLRDITDRLYVPEPDRRLRQEIVLGIGGVRALRALGMVAGVFHLNEGHSFLCAMERIRELRASRQMTLEEARLVARAGIVFTTRRLRPAAITSSLASCGTSSTHTSPRSASRSTASWTSAGSAQAIRASGCARRTRRCASLTSRSASADFTAPSRAACGRTRGAASPSRRCRSAR